jgi:ABC-type glutathione transport system ATPase component
MANSLPIKEAHSHALLRADGVSKTYISGGRWSRRTPIAAVKAASFEIGAGTTLALIGPSGCGKSTVARCVAGLERPDSGSIWLDGEEITRLATRELRPIRTKVQTIFQDAVTSLNPRFSAAEVIEEPLRIRGFSRSERRTIAEAAMQEVALSPSWLDRSITQFSGGQQQRLAIARALTTRPKLLVLDEALSGLDLSTQAQIANLLLDLQDAHGLGYLLISHDLTLVAGMADSIAVMAAGRIVENRLATELLGHPEHEETKMLIALSRAAQAGLILKAGTSA